MPGSLDHFYCMVNDKLEGPFDTIELAGLLKSSDVGADTLVCRQGTEEWLAYREFPEFADAQLMSIEQIARHIELKSRRPSNSASSATGPSWLWIGTAVVIGFVVLVAIANLMNSSNEKVVVASPQAAAPSPADWPKTVGSHFSVQAPLELHQVRLTRSGVLIAYKLTMSGLEYGVDCLSLPRTFTDANDDQMLDRARDSFFRGGEAEPIAETITSDHQIYGRDVTFALPGAPSDVVSGRVRFLSGKGQFFAIWVLSRTGKYNAKDADRFMASIQIF